MQNDSPNSNTSHSIYAYHACGLSIHSALRLPELVASEAKPDVIVHFGKVGGLSAGTNSAGRYIRATSDGVYLSCPGVGAFLVRGGHEIIVDPFPGVEEHVLRLFILGTSLGMVLHQRGQVVVLHASAVSLSGEAVAFVGVKGAGKSTMAAALHARGHDLVADDVLAIDTRQGSPLSLPGFPQMKLWPDTISSLGYAVETLPRLHRDYEKRGYRLTGGFAQTPVPLRYIYILDHGLEPTIERLRPHEALSALMPHWYGARFGMELLETLGLSSFFRQCADLVSSLTVCRLRRPPSLSCLPEVVQLVEKYVIADDQPAKA